MVKPFLLVKIWIWASTPPKDDSYTLKKVGERYPQKRGDTKVSSAVYGEEASAMDVALSAHAGVKQFNTIEHERDRARASTWRHGA